MESIVKIVENTKTISLTLRRRDDVVPHVGHRFFCSELFSFSIVSDTETGWKQHGKPDVLAVAEQLSDLGKALSLVTLVV